MTTPSLLATALSDRYQLLRQIARGGMGTVYLARDLKHDRTVALKALHPELAGTVGLERFHREIRTAASLHHPHILAVHDSGEVTLGEPGTKLLWFTMPFIEGESLRERLRRERQLPIEVALQIAREAARALDWAHQRGIIHRDIKPENILLTKDGSTLVADFGIARALDTEDRLTQLGMVLGTPAYMSPEQASGHEAVDPRTDIYSLGVVLYEMLTGELPVTGPTPHVVLARRLIEPVPSVRTLRPDVPEALDQAIQRALALEVADRFADAGQFAATLQTTSGTSSATGGLRSAVPRGRPPLQLLAGALAAVLLLGLVLFGWRPSRAPSGAAAAGGARVLAVLPFENLGDTTDAYFASGLTAEVRGKLAQVPGLEVIARGSSNEYRRTTKAAQEIARELGADYLLSGTVRWEKSSDGASRVRVIPELVEIRPGRAPRTRWQEPFDAALTGVFEVQAGIADKVTSALGVALADSVRGTLTSRPTASLAAYDAFLKGEAASEGVGATDPPSLRRALKFYQEAVTLDSTFVPAWAQLARASAQLFGSGLPTRALAETARQAAENAVTFGPGRPEGYLALGAYHRGVQGDSRRALATYEAGLRLAPNNVDLLTAVGVAEQVVGRWESAISRLERAASLDPRSARAARRYAAALLNLRRYDEADRAIDRAIGLAPTNVGIFHTKVLVALARGDLNGARRLVHSAPAGIDSTELIVYFATFEDLWWVLDESQQGRLLALPSSAFDDSATWGLVLAQMHHHRGDSSKARAYADSAVLGFENHLREAPNDGQARALFGLALAYAGRADDAVREGERGVRLQPMSEDAFIGPYIQQLMARIHLLASEPDQALDRLEPLLEVPHTLSRGWLRIDPTWDPLRQHPRFEQLIKAD